MKVQPEQTAAAWNALAASYDEGVRPMTEPYARDAVALLGVGEGSRMLDVAAGTGAASMAAARAGAQVLAIDFSAGMLEVLAARASAEELAIDTRVMDGQALTVESETFDAAVSSFGLMMFPDRLAGLREMHRALVPGGRAAITVWGQPADLHFFQLIYATLARAFPDLKLPTKAPEWLPITDRERLRVEMLDAGFASATVFTVGHLFAIESPEWLAERLPGLAPGVRTIFDRLDTGQSKRFCDTFAVLMREEQGYGPFAIESFGHIAVACKAP